MNVAKLRLSVRKNKFLRSFFRYAQQLVLFSSGAQMSKLEIFEFLLSSLREQRSLIPNMRSSLELCEKLV